MKVNVYWGSFWAWVVVGVMAMSIIADELMGIAHVWGLNPITDDAVNALNNGDPRLFISILIAGVDFVAWWIVHIKNHGGHFQFLMLQVKRG